jgi:hypothetical protein
MRFLICVVALLAFGAAAQERMPDRTSCRGDRSNRFCVQDDSLFRAFSSATSAGLNYSTAATFCTGPEFTSARAGATNGFCSSASGDHWESSASYALSAVGSPTTVSRYVTPNGPNGGLMTGTKLNGTSQYVKTTSTSLPQSSGDLSCGVLFRADSLSGFPKLLAQGNGGSASAFYYEIGSGFTTVAVYKSAVSNSSISSGAASVTQGALHLGVFTYDFVTDGTSRLITYIDSGTAKGTNNTAVGPLQSVSTPYTVGATSTPTLFLSGQIYAAFCVEGVVWDSTTIQTMADALIPQNTGAKGTRGESITTTRASVATCTAPGDGDGDGANDISVLPNNRPCITCLGGACGVYTEPSETNSLKSSEALDSADWSDNAAGTCSTTANTWDFGTGALSGETLTDGDAAVSCGRKQSVTTSATGAWTLSCYLKAGTASNARLYVTVAGGTGTTTCSAVPLTSTVTRATCPITAGAGVTSLTGGVVVGANGADTGTVLAGGCQLEQNGTTLATTYIPTTTATVTRSGVKHEFSTPAALSRTEGCARLTLTPIWTGNQPVVANVRVLAFASTSSSYLPNGGAGVYLTDGSTVTTSTTSFAATNPKTYRLWWSGARTLYGVDTITEGVASSGTVFTTLAAFDPNVTLGAISGNTNQPIGAGISNIVLGSSASGCQR